MAAQVEMVTLCAFFFVYEQCLAANIVVYSLGCDWSEVIIDLDNEIAANSRQFIF